MNSRSEELSNKAFCDADKFVETKANKVVVRTNQFATGCLDLLDRQEKAQPIKSGIVAQSSFIDMDVLGAATLTAGLKFCWGGEDGVQGEATVSGEVTDDYGRAVDFKISQHFDEDGLGEGEVRVDTTYSFPEDSRECNIEPDPHPLG